MKCCSLESTVFWKDNKLIERCKECGKEKVVHNFKKESILTRRDGYLNRDGIWQCAPDSWLSHNMGE